MDALEILVLLAMLNDIASVNKDAVKKAVKEANEEYNTDIKCELEKLKKERTEKKKQLDEVTTELRLIDVMIQRLESLDKKINN